MEISPPPLFLYQTTTLSLPYSLRTLPIQNTKTNVPTESRTEPEHCKHGSAISRAGELAIGNNDNQNDSVQPLRALQPLSNDAAVPIYG